MRNLRDRTGGEIRDWDDPLEIRRALVRFIADCANWDLSNDSAYIDTSRALVEVAHRSLIGLGTSPIVVDPFAGGGSIPVEALRVGADAFASDINPVATLLNRVTLRTIPLHREHLLEDVRTWGLRVHAQAASESADVYPSYDDGATPFAYLWARTIRCEGPGCGITIPLLRSL